MIKAGYGSCSLFFPVENLKQELECDNFKRFLPFIFHKIYWQEKSFIFSDGAAALVLVSGEKAIKLGLNVIGKISGFADAAQVLYISEFENRV